MLTFAYRVGGLAGAIVTCPLEVVKTRLQTDFYHKGLEKKSMIQSKPHGLVRSGVNHVLETCQILT